MREAHAATLCVAPSPYPLPEGEGVNSLKAFAMRTNPAISISSAPQAAPAPQKQAEPEPAAAPASAPLDKTSEASREEVANRLGLQRLEMLAERYLKDLRATAYIEKRL